MRLWHKALLPYLPQKQLKGQWRELGLVFYGLELKGTPNHLLVNKVLDYPIEHLKTYTNLCGMICINKGYRINRSSLFSSIEKVEFNELFSDWHNKRYLDQCLGNLQEKFDCGGIPEYEWERIYRVFISTGLSDVNAEQEIKFFEV